MSFLNLFRTPPKPITDRLKLARLARWGEAQATSRRTALNRAKVQAERRANQIAVLIRNHTGEN